MTTHTLVYLYTSIHATVLFILSLALRLLPLQQDPNKAFLLAKQIIRCQ